MVSEVLPGRSSEVGRKIQPTHGYYRMSDGWITIGPISQLDRVKREDDGWKSLSEYGAFDPSPYVINHELEGLFMMGGAKELTLDQVIKTGLYISPPLVPTCRTHMTQFHRMHDTSCWAGAVPVVFPQLDGLDLEPFPCEFCDRTLPTTEAKEQHQTVAHKEEKGNIQQGKSLGTSLAAALNGPSQNDDRDDLIKELRAQLAERPEATTETIEEPAAEDQPTLVKHTHRYGRTMGAVCKAVDGCPAVRETPYKARNSKP